MDLGQFAGHGLPQHLVVAQRLRLDTLDDLLGLGHQFVQFLVGTDIELAEAAEEFDQVLDRGVAKYLGLVVALAREPLGQMLDQAGQLADESLLRQLHGLVEPGGDPLALLFVQSRIEVLQIGRRFDIGKIPRHPEQAAERFRIVARIEQAAEPLTRRGLELDLVFVQLRDGLVEVLAQFAHAPVELVDLILADEPDAGFRVGERH